MSEERLARPSGELALVAFDGYGTERSARCRGRVIERSGLVELHEEDTVLDNLSKMVRRYRSRPGPGVRVRGTLGGREEWAVTDDEGFFALTFEVQPPRYPDGGHHRIELALGLDGAGGHRPARAVGRAFVPSRSARFGVISDVDDTIVYTHATDRLRMALIVFFASAHDRLPFSGVRAFYRALRQGGDGEAENPFFYVSSSSWHIYDVLQDFIGHHEMPPGPLLLRRMRFTRASLFGAGRHDHKLVRIEQILATYPELPFLLIGDNGQRDGEIYGRVAHRHPERILGIYLRDVVPARKARIGEIADSLREKGVDLLMAETTRLVAEHAASRGFIAPERLPEIERDEIRDEPRALVPALLRAALRSLARKTRPRSLLSRRFRVARKERGSASSG